jgi:hypothetical protein
MDSNMYRFTASLAQIQRAAQQSETAGTHLFFGSAVFLLQWVTVSPFDDEDQVSYQVTSVD